MKWIALILAILITVPPVVSTASYLLDDEHILLDGNMEEEEKEERESKDGEEKDKELNLDEEISADVSTMDKISKNAFIECALLSQYHTEDFFPPPEYS